MPALAAHGPLLVFLHAQLAEVPIEEALVAALVGNDFLSEFFRRPDVHTFVIPVTYAHPQIGALHHVRVLRHECALVPFRLPRRHLLLPKLTVHELSHQVVVLLRARSGLFETLRRLHALRVVVGEGPLARHVVIVVVVVVVAAATAAIACKCGRRRRRKARVVEKADLVLANLQRLYLGTQVVALQLDWRVAVIGRLAHEGPVPKLEPSLLLREPRTLLGRVLADQAVAHLAKNALVLQVLARQGPVKEHAQERVALLVAFEAPCSVALAQVALAGGPQRGSQCHTAALEALVVHHACEQLGVAVRLDVLEQALLAE